MSEYEPNEEVLKEVVNSIPEEVKTQIRLEKIANKDNFDYEIIAKRIGGLVNIELSGPPSSIHAAGAMINSAVAAVGSAHKMLEEEISIDDILLYIREALKKSTVVGGERG